MKDATKSKNKKPSEQKNRLKKINKSTNTNESKARKGTKKR